MSWLLCWTIFRPPSGKSAILATKISGMTALSWFRSGHLIHRMQGISGASSGRVRFAGSVKIPMQRREFIIGLGGVVAPSLLWPRLAHAQTKALKIGYLDAGAQRD